MISILALALSFQADDERPKVLFLTHSAGYRHDVLPLAERQLPAAAQGRLDVVVTQDCGAITAENLKRYAAVVFYTTGELPIADPQDLIDYVRAGGGFAGIHCATDTFYRVPAYGEMIGGVFDGHPWTQKVRLRVDDPRHPATAHLPKSFEIADEIYQFRAWDRKNVRVLLSLEGGVDLSKGKRADRDYALAWTRDYGGGRVFYTALGHGEEVWRDPRFLEHLVGGIEWAARARQEILDDGFESWEGKPAGGNQLIRIHARKKGTLTFRGRDFTIADGPHELAAIGPRLWIDGTLACEDLPPSGPFRRTEEMVALRRLRLPESAHSYESLFDGSSLDAWKMAGPGGFDLREGTMVARGGMGLLWHPTELGDFLLLLEWKVARKEDNSGVFVRFPDPNNDPWVAVHQGYEIQVCDPAGPKHRTGSIYSFQDATHVSTKAVGEWNAMSIAVVGSRYTVRVNGELVTEFTGDRSRRGFVGLQNHDDASRVAFRNLRVVSLK